MNGKLYLVTRYKEETTEEGEQVVCLDAKTGAVAWKTDTIAQRDRGYTITGAPEIAGDLVIIGNAGAEYDARGYVTAFDIADGSQKWRFWTIPHDPAEGHLLRPAGTGRYRPHDVSYQQLLAPIARR